MANGHRDRGGGREELISVAQAAALLGVHPNTVRAWTEAGRLTAYRINARGDRRFRQGDVKRLLGEGADAPELAAAPVHRRDAEIAVLTRLTQGSAAALNVAAVCRTAIEALRAHFAYPQVAIYLARQAELELETHAGYRVAPAARLPLGESHLTSDEGAPALSENASGLELRLPLRASGEVLGLMLIEDGVDGVLAISQVPFLGTVANAAATAIFNARLLARARREVTRARALRSVTQELTGKLDLASVLDDIVDRTRSLFDADKAGLWFLGDGPEPFQLGAARGIGEVFHARVRALRLESDAAGIKAIRERRTYVLHDADADDRVGPMRDIYAAEGIKTACLVPLVSHDQAVGVLGLYHLRPQEWPAEELALAQSFANQAAVAISNARLYRSLAAQAARMKSIQDLSARLNRLTEVQMIAEAIVAEASTLAEFHDIRVYSVDWATGVCEPVAYTRRLLGEGDFRERLRVEIGPGSFTGTVAQTGEAMLINDALTDTRGHTIDGTDDIEESMLVVPMLYEERAVGILALSKLGTNQFSDDDLQTMSIFAGYAAQAFANAHSYEQLARQSAELARQLDSQRRLLEINERLLSTLDPGDVLETIADGLRAVVSYDNLSIYRADHEQQALVPVLTREHHADLISRYVIPFGSGLMGWVVDHHEPALVNDALSDPRALQIPGTPTEPEAMVVVPLVSNGEVTGALNVSRGGGPEAYFSDQDFELVKLFAGQASIALRNADTHHAVSLRAETDALTGLGNHGAFQKDLARLLDRARDLPADANAGVALLMMDLDRFKAYNDRLGHPAGDALLHAVGTAIYGAARSEDLAYRYGGDEFALILSSVDASQAEVVAERARRAVARLTSKDSTPVTITIGVAAFPSDATDKNALIGAADTALYYGKQAGEDRVTLAGEVPREIRDLRGTLDELARAALLHPEDAGSVEHLVEHAARLSVAAADPSEQPVRDALLAVARGLERKDGSTRGHADRVGRLAGRIGGQLGCTDDEVRTIELAARLHDLEPVGAAGLETVAALRGVADIVRSVREPSPAAERSLAAQIVCAADVYDSTVTGAGAPRRGRAAALSGLREQVGTAYLAEVVEALSTIVVTRERRPARTTGGGQRGEASADRRRSGARRPRRASVRAA